MHPTGTTRKGGVPRAARAEAIGDLDILGALLGARVARERVATLGRALERDGGLPRLRDAPAGELVERFSLRSSEADRLVAAVELGRRVFGAAPDGPVFDAPEAVVAHNRDLACEMREHFAVMLLNARHRILERVVVSIGTLSASIVHPREVFGPAIRASAAAIVVVHNHPSGDPGPSRDDVEITRRLVRAGDLLGIPVLDHVIVARGSFVSLRRDGLVGEGSWA